MFQNSHPRAHQFGENQKNGAIHIFHLIAGFFYRSSECTDVDPIAIVSLDVKNAFNTLSRAHLAKSLLRNKKSAADSGLLSESPEARPDSDAFDLCHDI